MVINGIPRRLIRGKMVITSAVLPEFEMAITTSFLVIMPRSPWLASPGCTKNAGVPVLAKVAAILLPIWPDLPIPVTTTRPSQARIVSQARAKSLLMPGSMALTAWASSSTVRMPEVIKSVVAIVCLPRSGRYLPVVGSCLDAVYNLSPHS